MVQNWPLFGIAVRSPRLLLRPIQDEDFDEVIGLIDKGIHDPDVMPFSAGWTGVEPKQRALNACQHWWEHRATWTPQQWELSLTVTHGRRIVGMQSIKASKFSVLRSVSTGSWLGREYQGHGYGKEMRHAVLALAFLGLHAREASSAAAVTNAASIRVSTSVGYHQDGHELEVARGKAQRYARFHLDRETWISGTRPAVELSGLSSDVLQMFSA